MTSAHVTPQQMYHLGTLSTCEISDALVKLGHPTGGYIPDLERFSGSPGETVVGEAFTVEMVDASNSDAAKLAGHFVDLATPGSVVFISSPPHVKSASLGGLLATALHFKGVKGVMISGRCRDLGELQTLGLPVYARGHSTLGQSPFTRPARVQVPLSITPTTPRPALNSTSSSASSDPPFFFPPTKVYPFDIVVADIDGVVVVRPDMVDRVVELAEKGREVDEKCRRDLLRGKRVEETFKEHRGK